MRKYFSSQILYNILHNLNIAISIPMACLLATYFGTLARLLSSKASSLILRGEWANSIEPNI